MIEARDFQTNELIISDFSIYDKNNNMFIASGVTRVDSFVEIQSPLHFTNLSIISTSPNHYCEKEYLLSNTHIIKLKQIGNISVSHSGYLNKTSGDINLNISSTGFNNGISICLRWSNNIKEVSHSYFPMVKNLDTKLDCEYVGYHWINRVEDCGWLCKIKLKKPIIVNGSCAIDHLDLLPPKRLNNLVDRCYYVEKNIDFKAPYQVVLHFRGYLSSNENYVDLYVLDSVFDGVKSVYEGVNGEDVGALDYVYRIQ